MLFIIILKRLKDDVIFACFSVTCRFHCSIFAASLSATQPEKRKVTFHPPLFVIRIRQKHVQRERNQGRQKEAAVKVL